MSEQSAARDPDWLWNKNPPLESERVLTRLIRDGRARSMPRKRAMHRAGPQGLLEGWLPPEPLIRPETRVIAIGSCFAALFAQWLVENGYNRGTDEKDGGLLRSPLESPVAVAQQFRWAFGELDPDVAIWFLPDGTRVEASQTSREQLRANFAATDVAIVTLGLAEAWFDNVTGEPLWRVPPYLDDSGRFEPRVLGVGECVAALETIDRLRRQHLPNLKVLYTVSPVRFRATFRPMSPLVANSISKAIVRSSVDEFLRGHADEVGKTYFYFPSFEIVRELFVDPLADNIHVHPAHSAVVLDTFARAYTSLPVATESPSLAQAPGGELVANLQELQDANEELQRICDERARVIEELSAACDERLGLVERLNAELAAREAAASG